MKRMTERHRANEIWGPTTAADMLRKPPADLQAKRAQAYALADVDEATDRYRKATAEAEGDS